jgi:hypothetical protein
MLPNMYYLQTDVSDKIYYESKRMSFFSTENVNTKSFQALVQIQPFSLKTVTKVNLTGNKL